jgi:hypothetical protein
MSMKMESKMSGEQCLGRTPGYVRYSGYATPEEETKYLPLLGPILRFGDPIQGLLPPATVSRVVNLRRPPKAAP